MLPHEHHVALLFDSAISTSLFKSYLGERERPIVITLERNTHVYIIGRAEASATSRYFSEQISSSDVVPRCVNVKAAHWLRLAQQLIELWLLL